MASRSNALSMRLRRAVRHFWETRAAQAARQGSRSGRRDTGARRAATGGAQMDGFSQLLRELLLGTGVPENAIFAKRRVDLPGWFRPDKRWDLVVVYRGELLACVELKSHIGPSFGNNFNNRTEEALGSATDLLAAYREGAFAPASRPWLGYLLLVEKAAGSTRAIRPQQSHFRVFEEFKEASYCQRYQILLTKLMRDRLYDSTCLLLSDATTGRTGRYEEPSTELCFERFANALMARARGALGPATR